MFLRDASIRRRLTRLIKRWALYGVALVSLNCEAGGSGASFERVIENPSRYQHKRVTIYGRASVQGSGFELRSLHNPSHFPDESQVVHVVWRDIAANYDRFNGRPVVITGVIDTSQRGLWGYRCGIWLERISVLHPSPKPSVNHAVKKETVEASANLKGVVAPDARCG